MLKKKIVILSVIVLVVLTVITAGFYFFCYKPDAENLSSDSQSGTYLDFSNYPTEIEAFTNTNFKLRYDNQTYSVDKLNSVPLNESYCKELFDNAKSLKAMKIFPVNGSVNDYGFDYPKASFNITVDNEIQTLKIGSLNPDKTGYYFLLNESNEIALISTATSNIFLRNLEDYASLSNFFPYSSKEYSDDGKYQSGGVQSCSIWRSDLNKTVDLTMNSDGKLACENLNLDQDTESRLESSPFSLTANSLYAYNLNDQLIASCGLSSPHCTVSFKSDNKQHIIKIGYKSAQTQYKHSEPNEDTEQEDENITSYYVSIDDIPAVYSISENYLPWLSLNF